MAAIIALAADFAYWHIHELHMHKQALKITAP
jgi:hypothetical protein